MDHASRDLAPVQAPVRELTVTAALIIKNPKILVCQRHRYDSHGLQWEFPGGKVEPGESAQEALARELREELDVDATIGREVYRTRHRYADSSVELVLIFFMAYLNDSAVPRNMVFERFEWVAISSLEEYDFLQADKELVKLLASGSLQLD